MGKPTRRDYFDAKAFSAGLRSLLESLPTGSEKQEIQAKLTQITDFVSGLNAALGSLPSREEAHGVTAAIDTLERFAAQAKSSPVLAAAMGLKEPRPPRTAAPLTDTEMEQAKRSLESLQKLGIDELRANLEDERLHSPRELRGIAVLVGLKPNPKTGRASLVQQIGTKIANYRGYQDLSGGEPGNPSSTE
jgi:hypothetical protein